MILLLITILQTFQYLIGRAVAAVEVRYLVVADVVGLSLQNFQPTAVASTQTRL